MTSTEIKSTITMVMLAVRVIYALGMAIRDNVPNTKLDTSSIEKDVTDTLTKLDKQTR